MTPRALVERCDREAAADAHFGDWRRKYASMASAFALWIEGDRLQVGTQHMFEPAIKLAQAFAEHRLAAAPRWLPIDTAPKDGTRVLLWLADYHGAGALAMPGTWCRLNDMNPEPRWYDDGSLPLPAPAAWQPLPPPPERDANG